jgi:hypothetical protein
MIPLSQWQEQRVIYDFLVHTLHMELTTTIEFQKMWGYLVLIYLICQAQEPGKYPCLLYEIEPALGDRGSIIWDVVEDLIQGRSLDKWLYVSPPQPVEGWHHLILLPHHIQYVTSYLLRLFHDNDI